MNGNILDAGSGQDMVVAFVSSRCGEIHRNDTRGLHCRRYGFGCECERVCCCQFRQELARERQVANQAWIISIAGGLGCAQHRPRLNTSVPTHAIVSSRWSLNNVALQRHRVRIPNASQSRRGLEEFRSIITPIVWSIKILQRGTSQIRSHRNQRQVVWTLSKRMGCLQSMLAGTV